MTNASYCFLRLLDSILSSLLISCSVALSVAAPEEPERWDLDVLVPEDTEDGDEAELLCIRFKLFPLLLLL